jgi:tRNA-uridine 2-sulfurtransferase
MSMPRHGERVVVAMSGGVDSSVAAALLVQAGYDVIGIAMRLWGGASGSGCCSLDDFLDARRVAAQLGIPFYVMDFRDAFARHVVEPFIDEYVHGRTPNPCVRCNQFLKFASLWERARELGARWVATGHYARVQHEPGGDAAQLLTAIDATKDQSYFLFAIEPDVLARTVFPLGALTKTDVRAYARGLRLPVAEKPESQEVCFVPKGEYAAFVSQHADAAHRRRGPIVDDGGRILGEHDGIHRFTVGQRRGLGVAGGEPLYVTAIEPATGTVRVGRRAATLAGGVVAARVNWLGRAPAAGMRLQVKIRSRFTPTRVTICESTADSFAARADGGLPAVTPGQAAVLYDGERVVGGGWIERALPALELH